MPSATSFLRQLSGRESWKSSSKRWNNNNNKCSSRSDNRSMRQIEGLSMYGCENGLVMRKRVMVVVDHTSSSKQAMMWALTHVTNKADLITLLHVIPHDGGGGGGGESGGGGYRGSIDSSSTFLANSLGSLCKACKPEVEVEALVIQGPKLATVLSQVKKLEVSVLVLGQKKPSSLLNCLCGPSMGDDFVEQCINNADCLTLGVRKQSNGMGGFLISSRWQKNFWLLA